MKKLTMLVCGLMLVSLFVFPGNPNPMDSEAKYYEDARVIRIKYSQGETYVKRSYEEGFEEAAVNLPVFDKDTVGTTEGRIELYLGSLNYLRLDFDTEIEFEKAPALRTTGMVVRINKGGIYLNIDTLEYEKDIEIQTPGCGVFLLDKGAYRIDVHESGKTDVFVFAGAAEVAGDNESKNLIAGQKIVMLNGAIKEHPFYFYASDRDDFDEWNDLRNKEAGFARYSSANYLEDGYEDCEYELSRNGRWKYETTYQTYIWIPYNVGANWTPYYYGRWIWNPFYGHVWHSYDPWGWYCHHYGRWHWSYYDGWCWVPGYYWSPAWVHWYGHGHYYGWCPMSHYNRPIVVINKRWLKNYDDRKGIPSDSSSLVVVKKNQLAAANIQKVALKKGELTSDSAIFKGATNVERPVVSRIGVIDSKGNRVVYKEGGIASTDKYKTISSQSGSSSAQGAVYKYNGSKNADIDSHKYSDSTVTKEKVFKSSNTPVTRSKTDTTTGAGTDVKVFKSGEPAAKTGSDTTDSSARERKIYKSGDTVIKSKTYKSDAETAGRYESRTVSKKSSSSKSESSSGSQSGSTGSVKVYKDNSSSSRSTTPKSSSPVTIKKIKKKDDSPNMSDRSYSSSSSSSSYSTSYPGSAYAASVRRSYRSRTASGKVYSSPGTANSYDSTYRSAAVSRKSYSSSTSSYSTPTGSYRSYNNSYSSPGNAYTSPSKTRSYSSQTSYNPSTSYRYYSVPRSSSTSSYAGRTSSHTSSSFRSSSSASSRSYSSPSISRSSSVRSSSSGSSSSGSIRKK